MDRNLCECLENRESTKYILPFFWQHGESHEVLREEIDAIYRANIREFCVESRTHEQFGEEQWWDDMAFMLSEAKKRGMRLWLLDDKHFPTGYANGWSATHPESRKKLINTFWADYSGPMEHAKILLPIPNIQKRAGKDGRPTLREDLFVSVTAYRREHNGQSFCGEGIDLMPYISDGLLTWDIPEGSWRIFYIYRDSRECPNYLGWIDMLSPEGCEGMIRAVYEPHYEHFREYFGNTFAGFFSDEPAMGNDGSTYWSVLGKPDMPLPWRDDVPALIAEKLDIPEQRARMLLPALFNEWEDELFRDYRVAYMDVITSLYRECFTKRLGEWCREHGVMYIGHIIEDMDNHQRLGCGPGHFFRALEYEDMSGMDIVLQQIIPGLLDADHAGPVCGNVIDPAFFNYYQGKLPTSQAHLTPRMEGRAMCEIFGAFGWAEGVPMMKQLLDHMISNGINYYVPHAFSPKYPDPDCPPHFYARGMNPQFEAFGELMNYMRRCCHMISDGVHRAPAAMLYMAEAEWSGGRYLRGCDVGKPLIRAQIDYDILWEDILPACEVRDGVLYAGGESYRAFIVPQAEYLPENILRELRRFETAGLPVLYVTEDSLDDMIAKLRAMGAYDVTLSPAKPLVRYHRLDRGGRQVWFFYSEDIHSDARFTAHIENAPAELRLYDAWSNRLYIPRRDGDDVEIYLPAAGSVFLVEDGSDAPDADYFDTPSAPVRIENVSVTVCKAGDDTFSPLSCSVGDDVTEIEGMERFAGVIRYEGAVRLTGCEKKLIFGCVGEVAHVFLNGHDLGWTVCAPYAVDIPANTAVCGENRLTVEVINNLGYRGRDDLSVYLPLPRSGLLGPVTAR